MQFPVSNHYTFVQSLREHKLQSIIHGIQFFSRRWLFSSIRMNILRILGGAGGAFGSILSRKGMRTLGLLALPLLPQFHVCSKCIIISHSDWISEVEIVFWNFKLICSKCLRWLNNFDSFLKLKYAKGIEEHCQN